MFGPLNGVRSALVTLAALAAVLGYWTAALVLAAGVAVHSFGWFYLAQQSKTRPPGSF